MLLLLDRNLYNTQGQGVQHGGQGVQHGGQGVAGMLTLTFSQSQEGNTNIIVIREKVNFVFRWIFDDIDKMENEYTF